MVKSAFSGSGFSALTSPIYPPSFFFLTLPRLSATLHSDVKSDSHVGGGKTLKKRGKKTKKVLTSRVGGGNPFKNKKLLERIAGDDPSLAAVVPLFLYSGSDLYTLDVLASILNDVPSDSPNRFIADLIERLVTCSPAKQEWTRQDDLAPIIGPTPCTPTPGSPLYVLNEHLQRNPCVLRIEGLERADGNIEIDATHIPLPMFMEGKADRVLWLLWEVFYRKLDLTRLKKCSVCHRWFVDHSKNKSKTRCSARCTSQRWSWEARKQAGHSKRKRRG